MRIFLDECLSPRIAQDLNVSGEHIAFHPRNHGGLGMPDHLVLARCLEQDLVLITENAVDFRGLVAREELHPGLIVLPNVGIAESAELISAAITYIKTFGEPMDVMLNQVLEIAADGGMQLYPMPG